MIALREAYLAGLFKRQHWLNNIVAGAIVGVVALPLAMAFAIASGAKPEQGLYTAIVAGFFVSVFGGSRVQIAGPTGAFIVVLASITAQHGIEGLQLATLMAGLILLFLGLAKLGSIIKFIPDPVIVGFTAGIGVIIFVGQWQGFFGLPSITGEHFHNKLLRLFDVFPQLHLPTTLLGLATLVLVIFGPKVPGFKRIPGPLIGLLAVSIGQYVFHFEGVQTVGTVFGELPQGWPELTLPTFSWSKMIQLIGPAFAIAMLGAIESLLSAVVADGMTGTRHNSNQELVGQGLANVVAPLFGGFAATGAIARTATNARNGGTSPLAGITHSVVLLLMILFAAPLAVHIPMAVLAAILFVVAWNMSEAKHFIKMVKRAPRADVVILLITFLLTVFADLVVAVNIGVILATLHFMRRMSTSVEVKLSTEEDLARELANLGLAGLPKGLLVFAVEGPFFFGAVESFERTLASTFADPKYLIIRLKWVPFIDITGLQTLEEAISELQARGVKVMLSGANTKVYNKLKKAGILDLIGEDASFKTFELALDSVNRAAPTDQIGQGI